MGIYTANTVVSHSVACAFKSYPRAYLQRLVVIPNAVPVRPMAKTCAESYILPRRDLRLLVTVGRLAKQKNQSVLLQALQSLPSTHLVVVGDGELFSQLQAEARDLCVSTRVTFAGELPQESVWRLVASADVFLMPSLFEGMSNALLEAIALGVPIVASDIPASREVLVDGNDSVAGLLVSPSDPDAWAQAIDRLLRSRVLCSELLAVARRRSDQFTLERMISAFASLLVKPGDSLPA